MSFFYARIGAVTGSRAGRHTRLQKTASGPWRQVARFEVGTVALPVAPARGPPEQPGLSAREGPGHRRKGKVGMHKAGKSIEKA